MTGGMIQHIKRILGTCFLCLVMAVSVFFSSCSAAHPFQRVDYFPVGIEPSNASPLAVVKGILALRDGCLCLEPFPANAVHVSFVKPSLLLWPYGYSWQKSWQGIEVVDNKGKVVARLGQAVTVVGGKYPKPLVSDNFAPPLPADNQGPYWYVVRIEKFSFVNMR
jgi:hypothetical protein